MKFRTTAIYLLVLLVIGGAYAAMKVERQKTAKREKAAKRVFTFVPKAVSQIKIVSGSNKAITLEKTGKWKIVSPIVSQVDPMQLNGLLATLHKVEMQRKIGKPSGNLKAFGLDKPTLVVHFFAGGEVASRHVATGGTPAGGEVASRHAGTGGTPAKGKWFELQAGAKNPVKTGRYAMAGKNGEVFLISNQAYDDLNKSLTDLRRKELFTWQPGQVKAFQITWSNGDRVDLVRQGDTSIWKSKSKPDIKISADKVDNLLDGLHWLRASNFLAKDAMPSSPEVDVTFELKDGKTPELKVAPVKPGEKQTVATSSQVQCPVLLPTYFISSIPHSAQALVDRSLVSAKASDVKKFTWKTTVGSGNLVRINSDTWGRVEGSAAPRALKNSWPVQSFLDLMHNAQYIAGSSRPAEKPPQGAGNSIRFVDVFGRKTSLTWKTAAPKDTGPVYVWLEKDGSVREVQLKHKLFERIGDSLAPLNPAKKQ